MMKTWTTAAAALLAVGLTLSAQSPAPAATGIPVGDWTELRGPNRDGISRETGLIDRWVLNGQKVWSSMAMEADFGMLLARTDFDVPKHAGISWFAFPLDQPGVTIRPLREMTGEAVFNEVFLDDAVCEDAVADYCTCLGALGIDDSCSNEEPEQAYMDCFTDATVLYDCWSGYEISTIEQCEMLVAECGT